MTSALVPRAARFVTAAVLLSAAAVSRSAPVPATEAADDFKFMPADSNVLFVFKMDQLLASDGFKKLRQQIPRFDKDFDDSFRNGFGLDVGNIERMVYGGNVKAQPIGVFHLKNAVKADAVKKAAEGPRYPGDKGTKFTEEKVGTFTVYVPDQEHREAFCLVNDKTLVSGRIKDLRPGLERNKKPEFSTDMQAALKELDPNATVNVALDLKALLTAEKPPTVPGVDYSKIADNVGGANLAIKVGREVEVRSVAVCNGAKGAEEVKRQADALLTFAGMQLKTVPQVPRDILELPGKVKTETKDNLGVATVNVSSDTAINLIRAVMVPVAPPPPNPPAEAKPPTEKQP